MSLRFRIAFSGACAVLAVLLCLGYADGVRAEAEQMRSDAIARFGGEVTQVVVASGALEPGEVVGERDVALRDWVSQLVPEGALTRLEDVVGREVTVPVGRNAPVSELAFREEGASLDIPEGSVAVSIPVTDKLGVSRNVRQGARVAAYRIGADGTQLICPDAQVLSAPAQSAPLASGVQLTFAVPAQSAADVLAASASGDLRMVLPADGVDLVGTSEEPTAPAPLPPAENVKE